MRHIQIICFAVLVLAANSGTYAQSGQGSPTGGAKANRRPDPPKPKVTPSPTPTIEPQAKVEDAVEIDGPEIVVDTELVTVPVRVMDRKGRFLPGLTKDNFKIFEDNVEQEISLFSNDAQPFTVALVLDMSYSTKFKIAEIQSAAIEFIDQLRPNDRVMVISFDEDVHLLCAPTNDRERIYNAIRSTQIATGTSLYEAVSLTINDQLRRIDGRKAMVLFTDGVDTTSRRSNELDNLRDALEIDALIYPIRYDTFEDVQRIKNSPGTQQLPGGIPGGSGPPAGSTPPTMPGSGGINGLPFPIKIVGMGRPDDKGTTPEEYRKGEEYLDQLAIRSGGRGYLADTLSNLSGAFAKIASELREFYTLGYYPKDEARPGKVRHLKVKTDLEKAAVKARDSYVVGEKKKKG